MFPALSDSYPQQRSCSTVGVQQEGQHHHPTHPYHLIGGVPACSHPVSPFPCLSSLHEEKKRRQALCYGARIDRLRRGSEVDDGYEYINKNPIEPPENQKNSETDLPSLENRGFDWCPNPPGVSPSHWFPPRESNRDSDYLGASNPLCLPPEGGLVSGV